MPPVDIAFIRAKSGNLELKAVFQHDDDAKVRANRVRVREKLLHGFGPRTGSDVVILRRQTAHHVAHTTASEVRDIIVLAQTRGNFARRLFHRRWFHHKIR